MRYESWTKTGEPRNDARPGHSHKIVWFFYQRSDEERRINVNKLDALSTVIMIFTTAVFTDEEKSIEMPLLLVSLN